MVIPVYQGERTLATVVDELAASRPRAARHRPGRPYRVTEVVLVHDCGPDASRRRDPGPRRDHDWVRPVWLSRNFGQHAATLAGIAASGGEWVVTMDEDGQHDPEAIGALLDTAMTEQADVVYARPTNEPPHGAVRNAASRGAKAVVERLAKGAQAGDFNSYRLLLGEVARRSPPTPVRASTSTSPSPGWPAGSRPAPWRCGPRATGPPATTCAASLSHFWRLVLSSGTRPLRWVSALGAAAVLLAPVVAVALIIGRALGSWEAPGWTSTMILLMVATGVILFSLGVIAEYVGMAVNMAMGKPLYLPVRDRRDGPLGRDDA